MHHMKWRGSRYRLLAILAGLTVLASATAWLLAGGDKGAAIATVLCFSVAVLALGADMFGVSWHRTPDTHAGLAAAARALGRKVGQREAAEQQKFLADAGESQPPILSTSSRNWCTGAPMVGRTMARCPT